MCGWLRRRTERGQAVVEFVLVVNVLLVLFYVVWQFGALFGDYIDVTDAARTAARRAASYGADPSVANSILDLTQARALGTQAAQSSADLANMRVNITAPTWDAGQPVTATVTAPYRLDIFGLVISSGDLSSSTTMRIEARDSGT